MTPNRHGSSVTEYPSALEIATTREFDAPLELVFDVLTKPEHVRQWFAAFDDRVTVCEIDLRVGGDYHFVSETPKGRECSFRGTYAEVEPPTRTGQSWLFEGWPGAWADETTELRESAGVTTLTNTLVFRDQAGRDHMQKHDGQEDSWNKMEDYLRSLVEQKATVSG
ncbi:MAG TPA: SRPBCC domain-containing protein [Gaiellaceae bacterium]